MCGTLFFGLLQGAALGAARDMVHSAHIFVAIQAHKGLTAFALGCSLVESAAPQLQFWSLVRVLSSIQTAMLRPLMQSCAAEPADEQLPDVWQHVCMLMQPQEWDYTAEPCIAPLSSR